MGSEDDGSIFSCDIMHGEKVLANCVVRDLWKVESSNFLAFDLQDVKVCRRRRGRCCDVSDNAFCERRIWGVALVICVGLAPKSRT